MSGKKEKLPLDARLLSDAVIELNISGHNVSVYPKGHHLIDKSLDRAFDFLAKLFQLRDEITLAVAKDTLIIDDHFLDKNNPVFREFALTLSDRNIAYVTFQRGLSRDDIYAFQRFLLKEDHPDMEEDYREESKGERLSHIKVGFVDYNAFSFDEHGDFQAATGRRLWEDYVFGLLEGRLGVAEASDVIRGVKPMALAKLLNRTIEKDFKEESYERVIGSYLRRTSDNAFSGSDLKKLTDFINGIRPELKRQFLTSAVRNISENMDSAKISLGEISVDSVIDLISMIDEQKVVIPKPLKNLLGKFSLLNPGDISHITDKGEHLADDILISDDMINLMTDGDFTTFVSDSYQAQIDKILKFDASKYSDADTKNIMEEFSETNIERGLNRVFLEMIATDTPFKSQPEEQEHFVNILKARSGLLLEKGYCKEFLEEIRALELRNANGNVPGYVKDVLQYINSPEYISMLVDSLLAMGKQKSEDVLLLCDYYRERIAGPLIEALIEEDSQSNRKFLMSLIDRLKDVAVPELLSHLKDSRWYVKRNMIYILDRCGHKDITSHIRPYARHENPKVSFPAIKFLLKAGDSEIIDVLRDLLNSEDRDMVEQAIELSGIFKVRDMVPDLMHMLRKKAITGADMTRKIPVVKALGRIGDPAALDDFRNIISSKSILFKSSLEKLKEGIYHSLKNFSYDDVKDLLVYRKGPED